MDVLVTCVGQSDPYNIPDPSGKTIPGPILTLLEERRFDAVELFWTPGELMNKYASDTRQALIRHGFAEDRVGLVRVIADDPADFVVVLDAMREACLNVRGKYEEQGARYYAQVSSGTPQMGWSWIVLAQTGVMPATLIALRPRYIKGIERPYAYDVDVRAIARGLGQGEVQRLERQIDALRTEVNRLRAELESSRSGQAPAAGELGSGFSLPTYLEQEKRRLYAAAIARSPDSAAGAARLLGIKPHTFRKEAHRLGLRPRAERG